MEIVFVEICCNGSANHHYLRLGLCPLATGDACYEDKGLVLESSEFAIAVDTLRTHMGVPYESLIRRALRVLPG